MRVLTASQLEQGVDAALLQARGLITDARALLGESESGTSTALAFLAIEEVGKAVSLRNAFIDPPSDWGRFWSMLRNHRKNIEYAITFYQLTRSEAPVEALLNQVRMPLPINTLDFQQLNIPEPKVFTNMREEALYVFFDAHEAKFSPPIAFPKENLPNILKWIDNLVYYVESVFLGDLMKGTKVLTSSMADRIAWIAVRQLLLDGRIREQDGRSRFDTLRASFEKFVGREV